MTRSSQSSPASDRSEEITGGADPEGVLVAVLTPMDDGLAPDHPAFSAHCHRLLAAGRHGLSVFGTTGEANSLSVGERLAALEALLEQAFPRNVAARYGIMRPHRHRSPESRGARSRHRRRTRAAPFYYKGVGDEGLFRFFAEVIERIGDERLRLYLYHIPQMTGIELGLPLISRLIDA